MRKLLTICGILLSLSLSAQWQLTGSKVRYVNGIGIPTKDTAAGVGADSSQIVIRPADSSLYRKYKRTWRKVGGSEFTGSGTGSSTSGFLARWSSSTSLINSNIYEDNSGNLGLGTAFPNAAYRVTVAGSLVQTLSPTTVENTVAGTTVLITSTLVDFGAFGTKSNHHLGFVANNDVKASITPTGQFNIGGNYTSTNNTLQVTGNAAIGYTSAAPANGLTVSGQLGVGTSQPNGSYAAEIVGSLPLILNSTSNATSSTYGGVGFYRQTNTANNGNGFTFNLNNSSSANVEYGYIGGLIEANTAGAQNGALIFAPTSAATRTERMRITSGGEVLVGNTDNGAYNLQCNGTGVWGAGAYVNGSDSALKDSVNDLENALDLVMKMKPKTYKYREFYNNSKAVQTGFIAQDLEEVLKDKVYKDGIVISGGKYKGVAYEAIIPLLVKTIQEQQSQIDDIKKQIEELKKLIK